MTGGCHCGRVRFRVTVDLDNMTYCNCSICSKKGFLHLILRWLTVAGAAGSAASAYALVVEPLLRLQVTR